MAWNDLAGLGLSRDELAAAARRAENDVAGAPTGVMDQMASLHGRAGHLVFLDTRSMAVEPVPFDPAAAGLALLVIDTKAPHALVDGEYAERHRSCAQATELLGVSALRDISVDGLDEALARLDDELLRRRVRHVVTENARVLDVVAALRSGADPRRIGPTLTASHASMRDDFEITVPEVDTAVAAALDAGAHGARMTGGGFGGCVLALVEADRVEPVLGAVEAAYADRRLPAAGGVRGRRGRRRPPARPAAVRRDADPRTAALRRRGGRLSGPRGCAARGPAGVGGRVVERAQVDRAVGRRVDLQRHRVVRGERVLAGQQLATGRAGPQVHVRVVVGAPLVDALLAVVLHHEVLLPLRRVDDGAGRQLARVGGQRDGSS